MNHIKELLRSLWVVYVEGLPNSELAADALDSN